MCAAVIFFKLDIHFYICLTSFHHTLMALIFKFHVSILSMYA